MVVTGFVWVGNSFCVSGHPYVGRDVVAGMRLAPQHWPGANAVILNLIQDPFLLVLDVVPRSLGDDDNLFTL